jgi:hypothetical protein
MKRGEGVNSLLVSFLKKVAGEEKNWIPDQVGNDKKEKLPPGRRRAGCG